MPYFKDINTIFVHIPKNAGTSIISTLADYCSYNDLSPPMHPMRKHEPILSYYNGINRQTFLKANKFAVIRNPLSRIVSWYSYLKDFWGDEDRLVELKQFPCYSGSCKEKFLSTDFNSWVNELTNYSDNSSCSDNNCPFHITAPQHLFLIDRVGKVMVSSILRYEKLNEDWFDFSSSILNTDKPPALSNKNVGIYNRDYLGHYSDKSLKKIKSIYAKDFSLLGYDL